MNPKLQLLKNNLHYIILVILIIIMTLLLFLKEKEALIIISRNYSYSSYHSNNYETIDIEILANKTNDYHFNKDFIVSTNLHNTEQTLSLEIVEIVTGTESILYKDKEYHQVIFKLKLPLVSNDYIIELDNAYLNLTYENNESIDIRVGELNYMFLDVYGNDISINSLSATHEEYKGINTIGGIQLELGNIRDNNINITNISVLSNHIGVNKGLITEQPPCDYTTTTKTCLNTEQNTFIEDNSDINFFLSEKGILELYIPITYTSEYSFIYKFVMIIDYEINGITKQLIIDDFPYMRTSIYNTLIEDDLYVYQITNPDN